MKGRPRIGHYAFWTYDRFPYFLGGEIKASRRNPYASFTKNDPPFLVEAGNYGGWHPARIVLPPKVGKEVLEARDAFDSERRIFEDTVERYWMFHLTDALKEPAPGILDMIGKK